MKQTNTLQMDGSVLKLLESMQKQNALYEQVIAGLLPQKRKNKVGNRRNVLKFTKREISQMPTKVTKVFAVNDMVIHYRLKERGVYEARYHRGGIHIEVSSKDLTTLKKKFIDKLTHYEEDQKGKKKHDPNAKTFKEYADEWLNIKRVTTKESTYREYVRMLERDILPTFGDTPVTEIDRNALQSYLMTYIDRGVLRMAHKIHLMLKCIFDMIADDYNIPTPMKKVVVPRFESKSGTAFTYEEEKRLVNYCLSTLNKDASHAYLVLLYAGLRRSELASINIVDGTWLECETSKERMGKNVVKRKVPFTPMMKRVLPYIDFEKAKRANLNTLQTTMRRICPGHHPHELRHTFISRCKESGVTGELVSIWAGHSLTGTVTTTVYTHYSEDFQLREAEKVDYLTWNFGEE